MIKESQIKVDKKFLLLLCKKIDYLNKTLNKHLAYSKEIPKIEEILIPINKQSAEGKYNYTFDTFLKQVDLNKFSNEITPLMEKYQITKLQILKNGNL